MNTLLEAGQVVLGRNLNIVECKSQRKEFIMDKKTVVI